jgi:hypothetical protein
MMTKLNHGHDLCQCHCLFTIQVYVPSTWVSVYVRVHVHVCVNVREPLLEKYKIKEIWVLQKFLQRVPLEQTTLLNKISKINPAEPENSLDIPFSKILSIFTWKYASTFPTVLLQIIFQVYGKNRINYT